MSEGLYGTRYEWTNEGKGHGFELFRALFDEYEGGHALVKLGGQKLFSRYGKRPMRYDVGGHVSPWQDLMIRHATDLLTNEEDLYDRKLEICPTEMENECAGQGHDNHERCRGIC